MLKLSSRDLYGPFILASVFTLSLLASFNGYAMPDSCSSLFIENISSQPQYHFPRWSSSWVDGRGVVGMRDILQLVGNKLGIKPKNIYRGVKSPFILTTPDQNINLEKLKDKGEKFRRILRGLGPEQVSPDEQLLIAYFLRQFQFWGYHHNFGVSILQAKGWARLFNQFRDAAYNENHWAHLVLSDLQSLKFILKTELPRNKNTYPDDDATGEPHGVMRVLESGDLKPEQLLSLVYRVYYGGTWYLADGPIKKLWQPLLLFNQKAVEFLVQADADISAEELVAGIRKIYSDVAQAFQE